MHCAFTAEKPGRHHLKMQMSSSTFTWVVSNPTPWYLSWWRILLQCRRPWFDSWVRKIPWRRDRLPTLVFLCFPVAQLVKNPPAMWETWVCSLGWEDPLEKGKATHSSILAWRIPWSVWSMGSQRGRHDWATFTKRFESTWIPNF